MRKLNKLKRRFRKKYWRNPNRRELGRMIIQASHKACWMRGKRGHWVRQRIREYLFNKHGIYYKKR